jgi:hypothetical protein
LARIILIVSGNISVCVFLFFIFFFLGVSVVVVFRFLGLFGDCAMPGVFDECSILGTANDLSQCVQEKGMERRLLLGSKRADEMIDGRVCEVMRLCIGSKDRDLLILQSRASHMLVVIRFEQGRNKNLGQAVCHFDQKVFEIVAMMISEICASAFTLCRRFVLGSLCDKDEQ